MTTTLRPLGPEEHDAAGGWCRDYDIRVNSRPVGLIRLAAAAPGSGTGRIVRLEVNAPDRRRGRATVAALAAEEVLRGWGCRHVAADIPVGAAGALRLASSLGYGECGRTMVKGLTGAPPELPPGITIRAVAEDEYLAWLQAQGPGFTPGHAGAGARPGAGAPPASVPGVRHSALRVLAREGADVGTLWVGLGGAVPGPGVAGHVVSVAVRTQDQRRGHGRTLMLEAERLCQTAGGSRLGLKVSSGNVPALRLYESLGYRTVEFRLAKPLC